MAKMVKVDSRLQIGVAITTSNPQEYNVRYTPQENNIYIRQTSDFDMRTYAAHIAEGILNKTLVRQDWQNKIIKWVTENIPGTIYFIEIVMYSEPNFSGNMFQYFYIGRTMHRIQYGGRAMKKLFVSRSGAIKAAERAFGILTNGSTKKNIRVTVYEQKLHQPMPTEISVFE